jgi:hypothetical protein|tara:strand:+ start:1453 stop:2073 length:621 start_codon:yes stop_codon:yes gene_type:complete
VPSAAADDVRRRAAQLTAASTGVQHVVNEAQFRAVMTAVWSSLNESLPPPPLPPLESESALAELRAENTALRRARASADAARDARQTRLSQERSRRIELEDEVLALQRKLYEVELVPAMRVSVVSNDDVLRGRGHGEGLDDGELSADTADERLDLDRWNAESGIDNDEMTCDTDGTRDTNMSQTGNTAQTRDSEIDAVVSALRRVE